MTRIAPTTVLLVSTLGLAGIALAGCGGDDGGSSSRIALGAVVVAGDFVQGHPGVLATLDPMDHRLVQNAAPAMAVGDDPILRHVGNELFVINRVDGNNVTILDDRSFALQEQLGTGTGTNPQDVAVLGDKLYVATFDNVGLTVLTRGSTRTTTIDLSADDPDGVPNCNSVYLVGRDLYVSCELLDNTKLLAPRGPGKVYVVDTRDDHVRATLTLGHENPFGLFEQVPSGGPHGDELMIPTISFADGSGCIERIIPGPTPAAAGCLVDNAALGGYASRVAFQVDGAGTILLAAVPSSDFAHSDLRGYDLAAGTLWPTLNASGETIGDVVTCPGGQIVVTDTTKDANGLRVFEGGAETTTAALPIGLPPTSTRGLVCY